MPPKAARVIVQQCESHTSTEIGRMLGVSGPTVRVWARALGVRCLRRSRGGPVSVHMARVRWIFDVSC